MAAPTTDNRPTVPSALSDLQRFLLAFGVAETDPEESVRYEQFRRAAVREFPEYARNSRGTRITDSGSAALSRSLRRLDERGYVERRGWGMFVGWGPTSEEKRITAVVWLTDEGRAVGEEIHRRHRDGRYARRFDTLD